MNPNIGSNHTLRLGSCGIRLYADYTADIDYSAIWEIDRGAASIMAKKLRELAALYEKHAVE